MMSTSTVIPTAHEAASDKIKLKEIWRELELARTEIKLLGDMMQQDIAVPQVTGIVKKMVRARKSARRGGGHKDPKLTKDLMKSKLEDAKEHLKETEKKLKNEKERMKNNLRMEERMIHRLEKKAKKKAMKVRKTTELKNKNKVKNTKEKDHFWSNWALYYL